MIYLWHADPPGVPFRYSEDAEEFGRRLGRAVERIEPELLLPGERRILTSGWADGCFLQHEVRVSRDGKRATFRSVSIPFAAAWFGRELIFLPETDATTVTKVILPHQRPYMMIALPGEEPGILLVVDLVYHYPEEKLRGSLGFPFSIN